MRLRGWIPRGRHARRQLLAAALAVLALLCAAGSAQAYVYWTEPTAGAIGRANLDGTGVNQRFIAGANHPIGVAVEGAHIYWANNGVGSIGRASLDGSHVAQSFIARASDALGLALEGAHIYWTSGDSIGRASLDGTGANQSFITGLASPDGVAVDALGPTGPPPTQPVKAGVYINCQNRREVNGSLTQTLIPLQHPRTCVIYGQPESISTLYPLVRAHWKGWGNATATVNAIWDNPSPREGPPSPIRAKAFRIRSGCDGRRFYTRVSVPGFRHTTIVLDLSAACTLPPL